MVAGKQRKLPEATPAQQPPADSAEERPAQGEKRRAGLGSTEPKAKRVRTTDNNPVSAAATVFTTPGPSSGPNSTPLGGLPKAKAEAPPAERPVYTDQCTAFVKSIAAGTSDDDLRALFAGCGEVKGLRHMRDNQGETRVRLNSLY